MKRQPTANSTANESSSESYTLPFKWTEAANILKKDTSRGTLGSQDISLQTPWY